jgi:hypothetical protein
MKGTREMISDDAAPSAGDSTAGETSSLPFDIRVAHQARMYDYLLGRCSPKHTTAAGQDGVQSVALTASS